MWRVWLSFALVPGILAQAQTTRAFEAASVKPTEHGRDANGISRSDAGIRGPGRFVAENSSLDDLIRFAYGLKEYQVSGPGWLNDDSESFDIVAVASPGSSREQIGAMVRVLLAERFKLAAHRENRMLPIYQLVVGKSGPKLKASDPTSPRSTSSGGGTMTATRATMSIFANDLARELKQPVFDRTGIAGAFDITLSYRQEGDGVSATPSLFTAIQESTGLILEPAKGLVEVLVIDHIEKLPSQN